MLFGGAMAQQASFEPQEEEESDEDAGFGLFDGDDFEIQNDSLEDINYSFSDSIVGDDDNEDDEEYALREALRQRQTKKIPFQYTQPTKEWKEKGYLGSQVSGGLTNVNRFWIDYLESDAPGQFLSGVCLLLFFILYSNWITSSLKI